MIKKGHATLEHLLDAAAFAEHEGRTQDAEEIYAKMQILQPYFGPGMTLEQVREAYLREHTDEEGNQAFEEALAMRKAWNQELEVLMAKLASYDKEVKLCGEEDERALEVLREFKEKLAAGLPGVTEDEWRQMQANCRAAGERNKAVGRYLKSLDAEYKPVRERIDQLIQLLWPWAEDSREPEDKAEGEG
jgi:hypothetical protein